MDRYPGFVGPSYTSQSKIAAADRCVNWYPEAVEVASGENAYALYPAPGFTPILTLGDAPCRGWYALNGRTFTVYGSTLYEITRIGLTSATAITRGTHIHNPDNTPVVFSSNGDAGSQLLFASGSRLYLFDLRDGTFSDLQIAGTQVGFCDGFFLALDPTTSTIRISGLENGAASQWDATQVAQRNDAPDKFLTLLVARREVWLLGSQTSAVWYNSGASPFPFIPNPSVFLSTGTQAPYAAAMLGDTPIWLQANAAGGGVVVRANGYTPERVSTHAMEWALAQYPTLLDAQGWTYSDLGHQFYVLTFPTAQATWVYDATTGLWHERGAWDGYNFLALAVRGHAFASQIHLTGDATTGAVYRMGTDLATDTAGAGQRRLRRAPHVYADGTGLVLDALVLDFEAGLGATIGQGAAPAFMLRWSTDGGHTYGSTHQVSAGPRGAYRTRAIWRRLGWGRDWVVELSASDPIPWRVIGASMSARPGRS